MFRQLKHKLLQSPEIIVNILEFYGFSKAEAQGAVGVYREYFSERGLFENRLYGGVPEMLGTLAGDDTCFVVLKDTQSAASLCAEIREQIVH